MQHERRHTEWTWTCSMDMDGHAVWTVVHGHDLRYGQGHAVWTWTRSMDLDIQHGHAA
jgi:hypothetical protein